MSEKGQLSKKAKALMRALIKNTTQEQAVKALTQHVEIVSRENKGETHKYIVRRCPRGDNCRDGIGGRIEFRDKRDSPIRTHI